MAVFLAGEDQTAIYLQNPGRENRAASGMTASDAWIFYTLEEGLAGPWGWLLMLALFCVCLFFVLLF